MYRVSITILLVAKKLSLSTITTYRSDNWYVIRANLTTLTTNLYCTNELWGSIHELLIFTSLGLM